MHITMAKVHYNNWKYLSFKFSQCRSTLTTTPTVFLVTKGLIFHLFEIMFMMPHQLKPTHEMWQKLEISILSKFKGTYCLWLANNISLLTYIPRWSGNLNTKCPHIQRDVSTCWHNWPAVSKYLSLSKKIKFTCKKVLMQSNLSGTLLSLNGCNALKFKLHIQLLLCMTAQI